MTFQLKTLKTLKERLEKETISNEAKYWYLAGALDFVFEDGKGIIDLPKANIDICKTMSNQTMIHENILKGNKSGIQSHPPFAPTSLKAEPIKAKPQKKTQSIESCKTVIMNSLPMGCMTIHEIIKYNNMKLDCNLYNLMNIAARGLFEAHKITRKPKSDGKGRGRQYEYSLPSDMPTKIVLNGDLVEQQRRV